LKTENDTCWTKKVTDEHLRSSEQEVEDNKVSSFEEVKIKQKLVGRSRWWRLRLGGKSWSGKRDRILNREEPMLMKEKKKVLSLLPHHYNSESPLTS